MNKLVRYCTDEMENETCFREHLRAECFVDTSAFLNRILYASRGIISGPAGSGKSTLLSMVRCFYDADMDFAKAFPDAEIFRIGSRHAAEMNGCPVLWMDLSDFSAKTYDEALSYYDRKMGALYRSFADYLLHPRIFGADEVENDIRLMNETADTQLLFAGLGRLINRLGFRNRSIKRGKPVVLLDEPFRVEIYARHFGYYDMLRDHLKRFLDIDVYERTTFMLLTAFAPPDRDLHYLDVQYSPDSIYDIPELKPICARNGIRSEEGYRPEGKRSRRRDRFWRPSVFPEDCYKEVSESQSFREKREARVSKEFRQLLEKKKEEVMRLQLRARLREQEEKKEEREEYALPLPACVRIPSAFAGAREIHLDQSTKAYGELNHLLRVMLREFRNTGDAACIYEMLQGLAPEVDTDLKNETLEKLKLHADSLPEKWAECVITPDDRYWGWIKAESAGGQKGYPGDMELIKSYVSVADGISLDALFRGAVSVLIDQGHDRYHAKASRFKRRDSMCFWTTYQDFLLLQDYFSAHGDLLSRPLPFVAYKGNMAVSREWASWDSHNGRMKTLISSYFRTLHDDERADLNEMYGLYLKAWNGMLPDAHEMSISFRHANAHELIIFLETIDAIVNERELADDSILFSEDETLWGALIGGRCWHEVGERLMN